MSSVEPSLTTDLLDIPVTTFVPRGRWREFWEYFSANHGAVAGLGVIAKTYAGYGVTQ